MGDGRGLTGGDERDPAGSVTVSFGPQPRRLRSGDEARWEFEVVNGTARPVLLSFRTSQRADVVLERHGLVAHRWSEGRMFLQVLGEHALAPGESWTFALAGRLDVPPGEYDAVGTVVCAPPLSPARTRVVVEPPAGG